MTDERTISEGESNGGGDEADDRQPSETSADSARPDLETFSDPMAAALADGAKYKEYWVRATADFDNYRKRARREVDDARKVGREDLLKEILPVFDNLERAIASAQRATEIKGVTEGLSMILKQFESTLGRVGIAKLKTTGAPFDPQFHEAIQQVETEEHPAGTVIAEVQPGYVQGDKLVRAAMVVVAKPKAKVGPDDVNN